MVSEQAVPRAHLYPGLVPPKQFAAPVGMARAEFRAMGTTVSLLLPNTFLKVGTEATRQLFTQWEQTLSRFLPESELSRLNQQAGTPVKVSDLLFRVTQAALTAAQETEGLFDPTLLTNLCTSAMIVPLTRYQHLHQPPHSHLAPAVVGAKYT